MISIRKIIERRDNSKESVFTPGWLPLSVSPQVRLASLVCLLDGFGSFIPVYQRKPNVSLRLVSNTHVVHVIVQVKV